MNTVITWEEIYEVVKEIGNKIGASRKEYDYILTVPKGGLMPSYFFADMLNIPVETITIQSYEGGTRGELVLSEQEGFSKEMMSTDKVLIIDDIYDSGATIEYLKKRFLEADTLCLYARYPENSLTFVGRILNHDKFIDFPWEGKV